MTYLTRFSTKDSFIAFWSQVADYILGAAKRLDLSQTDLVGTPVGDCASTRVTFKQQY